MSKRRVRLTMKQYGEIVESRDWSKRKGLTGLAEYYDEYLTFMAKRRALPPGTAEAREEAERDEERRAR